jgi:hypothetical protein
LKVDPLSLRFGAMGRQEEKLKFGKLKAEISTHLVCNRCPQREIIPLH